MGLFNKLCQYISNDDATIALTSGFSLAQTASHSTPPFVINHNGNLGEINTKAKAAKGASYIWQYSQTPLNAASWITDANTTQAKHTITGLTPGVMYWFRVALVADFGDQRIRKVNTAGIITTIAGTGAAGFSGDGGQATAAQLRGPTQVIVDVVGNIFILDTDNNRIRKVNTSGIITTVAGIGWTGGGCHCGYSGDGGQATNAELNYPYGMTFDATGNIYVADLSNYCIRMINTSGIISTIVGDTTAGFSGDGGQASAARLNWPRGVALDASGNLYIADETNNRVRKVANVATGVSQYSNLNTKISIYPNPSSGIFTIETNTTTKQTMQVYDVNGRVIPIPNPSQREGNKFTIDLSNLPTGVYNINITSNDGAVNKLVVIAR